MNAPILSLPVAEVVPEYLASQCPLWTKGTVVLQDDDETIVAYGKLERTSDGVTLIVVPAPMGVTLLSSS